MVILLCSALLGLLYLLGLAEFPDGEDGQRLLHRWAYIVVMGVRFGGHRDIVLGVDVHGSPGAGVS